MSTLVFVWGIAIAINLFVVAIRDKEFYDYCLKRVKEQKEEAFETLGEPAFRGIYLLVMTVMIFLGPLTLFTFLFGKMK